MTEADYIATAPRSGKAFTFTRIRGNATQEFLPGEGTRLKFASRAADTLELVDLPAQIDSTTGLPTGFLADGDTVTVAYKGPSDQSAVTVFRGEVDHISYDFTRGDTATQTAVVAGPWAKMARLVFKQPWTAASGFQNSSRLVLNQSSAGNAQNVNVALREICWGTNNGAPAACGYSLTQQSEDANINVSSSITLPFDECRDLTIADAIRRELRLFPAAVTYFDYSTNTPTIKIQMPSTSGSNAAYVASIPKTVRQYTQNPHPVNAVDLEIETVASGYRLIDHQRAAKTGATYDNNPNCLYATLQIAGAEASAVTQSLTVKTETRPELTSKTWWKSKHPRLANVAMEAFSISNQGYSGSGYPYLADCSADELKAYGKNAEVETFHCLCTITTTDDVEEQIYLSMDFVTTDFAANDGRTITRTVESSATSGETVPSNLAQQILDARSGELRAERFTMRLGTAAQWPTIGDLCDGLILQSFAVDCTGLTADLDFGAPEYLSPEDMAGLLTNFRNKRRATVSASRVSGKPESKADVEDTGIKPLSSTEWSPGIKSKTTFKTASGNRSGGGSMVIDATGASPKSVMTSTSAGVINLDTADVPAQDEVKVRTLTVIDKNNSSYLVHIPMCRDVTLNLKTGKIITGGGGASGDGSGSGGGDIPLPEGGGGSGGGGMFAWDETTQTIGPGGFMAGRQWVPVTSGTGSGKADGTYQLKITLNGSSSPSGQVVSGVTVGTSASSTISYIPIYVISGGKIATDYRGAFVVPIWETVY